MKKRAAPVHEDARPRRPAVLPPAGLHGAQLKPASEPPPDYRPAFRQHRPKASNINNSPALRRSIVAQVEVYILGAANFHSHGKRASEPTQHLTGRRNRERPQATLPVGPFNPLFSMSPSRTGVPPVRTSLSSAGEASLSTVPSFLWERPPVWLLTHEGSKMLLQACDMLSVLGLIWVFFECTGPLLLLGTLLRQAGLLRQRFHVTGQLRPSYMHLYLVFVFLITAGEYFSCEPHWGFFISCRAW